MASASSLLCEEQLQCSICLDVFTEPVSTPCGHNFCKACITGYWASSGPTQCPLCMKKFRKRPQLQVNTGFRDMVEHFNNMRGGSEDDIQAKPGEVPCDICVGQKNLKAQKTCLVCLASYCQLHLEPHQRVTTFKKHQLVDPVSNLEDRVCRKHDKMFELFCHEDQMCVCFMCLKDDHVDHEAVPLEHAFRERKAQVDYEMSQMTMTENAKSRRLKGIKYSLEQSKKESEKEIADIVESFSALLVSLQRSQAELIEVIQEKQKAAQKQAEDKVTQLEQEVAQSRRRRSEMGQLLQTEDHLHLLQSWPSLYFHTYTEDLFNFPFTLDPSDFSQQSHVGMVKKAVAQMEKTLSYKMKTLIRDVRSSDGFEAADQSDAAEQLLTDEFVKEVWTPPQFKLIQQYNAVDVTLDAYTANSKLVVSEDGKQLRFGEGPPSLPALFGRSFERQPFVLGKEGFSTGRFYYEVQVSGSKGWLLGVVKESINREILFFPTPEEGGWTFFKICNSKWPLQEEYFANADSSAPLYLSQMPQTVGVFVDYEKGEVSFYDVDARTLIYSYRECNFIETTPSFKAFLFAMGGTSLSSRPKLYPIFGIFENDPDNMLEITPVARIT